MKKTRKFSQLMCNNELMGIWRSNQVNVIYFALSLSLSLLNGEAVFQRRKRINDANGAGCHTARATAKSKRDMSICSLSCLIIHQRERERRGEKRAS